jgi:arsenate reductase
LNRSTQYQTTIYGIRNCDQVRKACRWLDSHQVGYHFHDYRVDGVPSAIDDWLTQIGWQTLVNRNSTSWRSLSQAQQDAFDTDRAQVLTLLRQTPTLIKRPLLVMNAHVLVGFDSTRWQQLLQPQKGSTHT